MEIRIRRQLTGSDLRREILSRYGSADEVAKRARKGDADAKDAMFNLRLLEEDPKRLKLQTRVEDILTLTEKDLSKLTWTRLHVLEVLRKLGEANVKELTAALKRDPKNVSEDVDLLIQYGLVQGHKVGKEKILQPAGNLILIAV